jgi:hypothetical protein
MPRTRSVIVSASALLYVMLFVKPVRAEDFQALQELFQSDVVFPQHAGETQMTLAPQFMAGSGFTRLEGHAGLEYGMTDAWQVGMDWTSYVRDEPAGARVAQGIGDLDIGTKYSWMNVAESGLHAALALAVTVPTANRSSGLGDGQFALVPSAVLAADIPRWPGAQAFFNLGSELNDGAAHDGRHPSFLNFGAFAPIRRITVTSEWNLSDANGNFYTPGIIWRTPADFELGIGIPIGLNAKADRYRVILTLVHEFE